MPDLVLEHPQTELLRAFSQGRLGGADFTLVAEHVATCESCCRALEDPQADSFVAGLQVAAQGATLHNGEAPTLVKEIPAELTDHPRYKVSCLIGQGGMGAVYKAEHVRMQRTVALKVINPALTKNPQTVERFHQEARATAKLSHPNIVAAFDADQAGDLHFLVMELVEGQTLAEVLAARGPLPQQQACDYVRQAALGLQHLHEAGLIHRDVKPHNLMLTSGGTVKMLDCGLVRFAHEGTTSADGASVVHPVADAPGADRRGGLTAAGTLMGTADYIAPEQAADPRTADIRADIYSLGCTLFHLLSGQVPFPEGSVAQKLASHAARPLPRLRALRPELPAELEEVVARMTAKDPAQRYATPAVVADVLSQFVRAASVSEQVAITAKRSSSGRARSRLVIAASLLLLIAGIVAGIVILRIPTDRGEVVLTTDDPGVELIARKGGELVRIRDAKSGQTLELDTKKLTLRDLEHPAGLALEVPWGGKVTFKSSGGKVVVTAGPPAHPKEPAKAAEKQVVPPECELAPAPKEVAQGRPLTDPFTFKVKFPDNLYLVRAKLKEVIRGKRFGEADTYLFAVEQVFAGEAGLQGKTFVHSAMPFLLYGTRVPPTEDAQLLVFDKTVGTEMLVWVRRPVGRDDWPLGLNHQVVAELVPIVNVKERERHEIQSFPYVKPASGAVSFGHQSWSEGLAWAKEVERVYQAKSPEERGDILRRLAVGQAFEPDGAAWSQAGKPDLQARWALAMLCNAASDEVLKDVRERAERHALSTRDGLFVDRMLCRLEGEKWYEAKARIRILGDCLEAETNIDFALACRRLSDAVRDHEITFSQFAALIDDRGRTLSEDQQWSLGRTLHAMKFEMKPSPLAAVDPKKAKTFGLLTPEERGQAFDWLTGIVRDSSSSVVRVHAAAGLKHLRPFSEREKKTLKGMLGDSKQGPDVRAELKALEAPSPTQDDEIAARRAVTIKSDYLIEPFYTGGWLVPRDKGWELPLVGKPTKAYIRPDVIFAGAAPYQVTTAELLDVRPALTRDPLLKELARVILKEPGFFYVVTLRGDADTAVLIRVQGGQGTMRGRMPTPPLQPNPMEDMVRAAAREFVQAHNVKDMPMLDRLVAEKWCHGGQFWLVTDGGKNTLTLYATPNFGAYGSKLPLGTPGWGPKFPDKLHENILHVSRYEQQRPAFLGTVEEMRALDKFVGERGYVISVGKLDEGGGVALLARIEKDAAKKDTVKIIGTMTGLQ